MQNPRCHQQLDVYLLAQEALNEGPGLTFRSQRLEVFSFFRSFIFGSSADKENDVRQARPCKKKYYTKPGGQLRP